MPASRVDTGNQQSPPGDSDHPRGRDRARGLWRRGSKKVARRPKFAGRSEARAGSYSALGTHAGVVCRVIHPDHIQYPRAESPKVTEGWICPSSPGAVATRPVSYEAVVSRSEPGVLDDQAASFTTSRVPGSTGDSLCVDFCRTTLRNTLAIERPVMLTCPG